MPFHGLLCRDFDCISKLYLLFYIKNLKIVVISLKILSFIYDKIHKIRLLKLSFPVKREKNMLKILIVGEKASETITNKFLINLLRVQI